jgi:hypothetical protein
LSDTVHILFRLKFLQGLQMKKILLALAAALVVPLLAMQLGAVLATPPNSGQLYYNGNVVRTLVPNGKPLKNPGTDPLYVFPANINTGYAGQYSVTKYAPGDPEYRGGHWAVWIATWNVPPYLLTSADAVETAATAGDITLTRTPSADVLCPVIPGIMYWP